MENSDARKMYVYAHLWSNRSHPQALHTCSSICVRACETVSVVLVETGDSPRALTGHSGWRRLSFEKGIDDSKFEQQHVPSSACDTV